VLLGIIGLFVCAFIFPNLYHAVWFVVLILFSFLGLDVLLLYLSKTGIEAERTTPEKLTNMIPRRNKKKILEYFI
jgi:hypothetical protein